MALQTLPVNWDSHCGFCNAQVVRCGKWCGGCRAVRYCDEDCQRAHWHEHNWVCNITRYLRELQRPEVPAAFLVQTQPFPEDEHGLLTMLFPGTEARDQFNFTRRTDDVTNQRVFVAASMRLLRREQWREIRRVHDQALHNIWRLVFERDGLVGCNPHVEHTEVGRVIWKRPLQVNLSKKRHLRVCLELASLGLGLVTGHRFHHGPAKTRWFLHDWRALVADQMPREYRRGLCMVGCACLLPKGVDLFHGFVAQLQRDVGVSDGEDSDGPDAPP